MKLDSLHFGSIDIEESEILSFPEGLPGFEETRQFTLLGKDDNDIAFFWLQSVDKPEVCFVVTDPFAVYNDYNVDIDDEEIKILRIENNDSVLVLSIVVIPENIHETRVNLKAPLLINLEKRLGKQVIQKNDQFPVKYYLSQK